MDEKKADKNVTQLNSDKLETVNGGSVKRDVKQISETMKEKYRKEIRNAKQNGATMEEFLARHGAIDPNLANFIRTVWDIIDENDYH